MTRLTNIIVTGALSGLGFEIAKRLNREPQNEVHPFDLRMGVQYDVNYPYNFEVPDDLDILVNCAGITKMDWIEDFDEEEWDQVMDVNVKGILKMSQHCLPMLKKNNGTILNIVSDAARKPMRCSAAYNASKAAALMLTKVMARELTAKGVTVFSVSPNRLAGTGMSDFVDDEVHRLRGFTRQEMIDNQKNYLTTGLETPPEVVADFINYLLARKENHFHLAGCDIQYGD